MLPRIFISSGPLDKGSYSTYNSFAALFMRILQQKDLTNNRYTIGAELKPDNSAYDQYLSTFYSNSNGERLFLVSRIGPNAVETSFLRTYGENAEEGLFDLVMMSIKHAQITLEPDTEVFIDYTMQMNLRLTR